MFRFRVLVLLQLTHLLLLLVRCQLEYKFRDVEIRDLSWFKHLYQFDELKCVLDCSVISPSVPHVFSKIFDPTKRQKCNNLSWRFKEKCNNKDILPLEKNRFVKINNLYYYYPQNPKSSFFGAAKFCQGFGFNFATLENDENVAEIFTNKGFGMKTIWSGAIKYENALTKNQSTFWPLSGNTISEKKTASNLKFSCLAAKVSEAKMVFEEDCKNENLFLCSVPLSCVQEFCPETNVATCSVPYCFSSFWLKPHITHRTVDTTFDYWINFGVFRTGCGGYYYFSQTADTYGVSQDACRKFGMQLVSLETEEEQNCVMDLAKSARPATIVVKSRIFWTSGTDRTCRGKFAWCGTGEMLGANMLKLLGPRDDGVNKNCLLLNPDSPKTPLAEEFCGASYRYICENKGGPRFSIINHPQCPKTDCLLDFSRFNPASGILKIAHPRHYLNRVLSKDADEMVIGQVTLSQSRAAKECCLLGRTLYDVMYDVNRINPAFNEKRTFNNKSFWSAELLDTSKSARGDYRHCPFGDIRPRTNILEAAGGNKKCVAFEFQNDKVVVFAADCNLEKYFICKNVWQYTKDVISTENGTKANCEPTCPFLPPEDKTGLFIRDKPTLDKSTPKEWLVKEVCGGIYVIQRLQFRFFGALTTCRGFGLQLLEIKNQSHLECLARDLFHGNFGTGAEAWVGGSLHGCKSAIKWCGSGRKQEFSSYPNFEGNNEYNECLAVKLEATNGKPILTLKSQYCYNFNNVTCEVVAP